MVYYKHFYWKLWYYTDNYISLIWNKLWHCTKDLLWKTWQTIHVHWKLGYFPYNYRLLLFRIVLIDFWQSKFYQNTISYFEQLLVLVFWGYRWHAACCVLLCWTYLLEQVSFRILHCYWTWTQNMLHLFFLVDFQKEWSN